MEGKYVWPTDPPTPRLESYPVRRFNTTLTVQNVCWQTNQFLVPECDFAVTRWSSVDVRSAQCSGSTVSHPCRSGSRQSSV